MVVVPCNCRHRAPVDKHCDAGGRGSRRGYTERHSLGFGRVALVTRPIADDIGHGRVILRQTGKNVRTRSLRFPETRQTLLSEWAQ